MGNRVWVLCEGIEEGVAMVKGVLEDAGPPKEGVEIGFILTAKGRRGGGKGSLLEGLVLEEGVRCVGVERLGYGRDEDIVGPVREIAGGSRVYLSGRDKGLVKVLEREGLDVKVLGGMPRVAEVMTRGVKTLTPDATAYEAASLMDIVDIGSVVVIDEEEAPVGMVTRSDILRAVVKFKDLQKVRLRDGVMSFPVATVGPDADLATASKMMGERGIKRLPVVKGDRLVGIVSATDLVRVRTRKA
ncbi:MAG: CBS domain-containing protein [Candidatus Hydrothermarchaeota archaeon]